MFIDLHQKVNTDHLRREAFVYVRQSTSRQILENTESTRRQYALRDRAVALGWPIERIHTLDGDQGRSGARAENRDGFQHLVSEVALGHAGIVLGLEVSRLARNNADWQRLLQLCALSSCLIGDEEAVYDPVQFNDRLLLGLKGTISAAELHLLKARLIGGQRNKARRGALEVPLPIGLAYNAAHAVVLDPDLRIQASLREVFSLFGQKRSATAVADRFRQAGLTFPRRLHRGIGKGQVIWASLDHSRTLDILHNPRYTGAFVYGRHRVLGTAAKKTVIVQAREDWLVLIHDAHPGYISWEEFERNQATLTHNRAAWRPRRATALLHESPTLLQGRLLCGVCGTRMQVRYDPHESDLRVYYLCQNVSPRRPGKQCQSVRAPAIDAAIGALLLRSFTPAALRQAFSVHRGIVIHEERAARQRREALQRLRHAADLKRQQFLKCDPDHRLVADALEAAWNEQLRRLDALQQEHEHQGHTDQAPLDEDTRSRILTLTEAFPQAWNDPHTSAEERRRWVGCLIEDVTLLNAETIQLHVRFRGGHTATLSVPRPAPTPRVTKTAPETIQALDHLLETCSDRQAAAQLNADGHRNWLGLPFTVRRVENLRQRCRLKSHIERLRARGCLTVHEMAQRLNVCAETVAKLGRTGVLPRQPYGTGHRCLYKPLNGATFIRGQGGRYRSTQARLVRIRGTRQHPRH
jgi:DNA invertase Pin-like site-specific DNA recombinase